MFARQRDPGLWTFDSVITGAELEYWDDAIANAIDGLNGGAYSLQADLTIGGAPGIDWNFDLPVKFNDATTFYQLVFFDESVVFDGPVNFYYPVAFEDDVTFSDPVVFNDTVAFQDVTEFFAGVGMYDSVTIGSGVGDVLSVQAVAHFYDDATFDGTADFTGAVTFDGSVAYTGTVVTNSAGNFRVRRVRRQTFGVDANMTIDMTATDHVIVEAGVLSAVRDYTISDTGAVNGDRVRFSSNNQTWGILVRNPGGTALESIGWITGMRRWVDFERVSGSWRAMPGDTVG